MADHAQHDEREVARRRQLLEIVDTMTPWLPADVVAGARRDLEAVGRRLDLGIGHRLVALVGGTGSGKSSLFNAITGLEVADVGTVRPTTAEPTACAWGSDAAPLLDHLGVSAQRRYRGEAALTGPEPGQLDGVVLLDVPDHDSIAEGHRAQVDALLPLVDLLVWVLDPQKYADNRLHTEYLAALAGRQEAMVAVVNQADKLTSEGLAELRLDIARLLVEEDLGKVEILATSARTGEGIEAVRETLRRVSLRSSVNRIAVSDQLDSVSRALSAGLGPAPQSGVDDDAAATRLAEAVGVGAVADSIVAAVRRGSGVTEIREAPPARWEAIRAEWLDAQAAGLTRAWRTSIDRSIPSAREIGEAAAAAVRQIRLGGIARAGVLTRMRPAALEREVESQRSAYEEAALAALRTTVGQLLAPSREVRDLLTQALEALRVRHREVSTSR
ncbi:GTPase [Salana multivorans]